MASAPRIHRSHHCRCLSTSGPKLLSNTLNERSHPDPSPEHLPQRWPATGAETHRPKGGTLYCAHPYPEYTQPCLENIISSSAVAALPCHRCEVRQSQGGPGLRCPSVGRGFKGVLGPCKHITCLHIHVVVSEDMVGFLAAEALGAGVQPAGEKP